MSYSKLIDKSLIRAFNLVKDLAKDATLTMKSNVDFDFSSAQTTGVDTSIPLKVIIIESKKKAKENDVGNIQVMFRVADIIDINAYDRLTIDSVDYKIGQIVKSNGYIYLIEIKRGM